MNNITKHLNYINQSDEVIPAYKAWILNAKGNFIDGFTLSDDAMSLLDMEPECLEERFAYTVH
ncbi:hypothetical protein [Streptomyces sp. G1]|uniref:hypothetical protein n=1 Tax=Streptomyces sp. G1 TaxID=361572 RepID=UPI00202DB78A|nr:hypothetical protein [Streptomyces sp. G1]MCM1967243.1 hypothetical protein [Streptomyces sp. G1]